MLRRSARQLIRLLQTRAVDTSFLVICSSTAGQILIASSHNNQGRPLVLSGLGLDSYGCRNSLPSSSRSYPSATRLQRAHIILTVISDWNKTKIARPRWIPRPIKQQQDYITEKKLFCCNTHMFVVKKITLCKKTSKSDMMTGYVWHCFCTSCTKILHGTSHILRGGRGGYQGHVWCLYKLWWILWCPRDRNRERSSHKTGVLWLFEWQANTSEHVTIIQYSANSPCWVTKRVIFFTYFSPATVQRRPCGQEVTSRWRHFRVEISASDRRRR